MVKDVELEGRASMYFKSVSGQSSWSVPKRLTRPAVFKSHEEKWELFSPRIGVPSIFID